MKTLRVRDIMTTDVQTFAANETVAEAARRLTACHVGGAPVVDDGRIIGMISKTDLLAAKIKTQDTNQRTVSDVMTPVVYAVRPTDPVMSAVRLMVDERIHRTVVVTDQGVLAGIVSSMDIMRVLASGTCVQEGDYAVDSQRERHSEPAVAVSYVDLRTFELAS